MLLSSSFLLDQSDGSGSPCRMAVLVAHWCDSRLCSRPCSIRAPAQSERKCSDTKCLLSEKDGLDRLEASTSHILDVSGLIKRFNNRIQHQP
jgi:hypothetical protein